MSAVTQKNMHTITKTTYGSIAGISSIIAGILHLTFVASQHRGIAPEWIFFIAIGIAQIAWALWFYKNQKELFHHIGIYINGALLAMWIFTRVFPAPFLSSPEHVDALGLFIVFIELVAIVSLVLWHNPTHSLGKFLRKFAAALGISFATGLLLYGGSMLSANTIFSSIEVVDHHGSTPHEDENAHETSDDSEERPHSEDKSEEEDDHHDGEEDPH